MRLNCFKMTLKLCKRMSVQRDIGQDTLFGIKGRFLGTRERNKEDQNKHDNYYCI